MTIDDALGILDDLDTKARGLTDWEIEFLDSVLKQVEDGRSPTARQAMIIANLQEKYL